ncbi:Uncharacterised protein [Mycobacterium tuberculosis]|nr:Uncharacterised protein [Mycobacterium tuberculosis]
MASHDVSSNNRCWGSVLIASRSLMPKNSQSKSAWPSINAPHLHTDRPGTPGSGS